MKNRNTSKFVAVLLALVVLAGCVDGAVRVRHEGKDSVQRVRHTAEQAAVHGK